MDPLHSSSTFTEIINEEVIYQNPLLFLKIWEMSSDTPQFGPPTPWRWHSHMQVEFLVVIEGQLGIQTKHVYTVMAPGDVIVLGSSQPHRTYKHSADALRQIVFQIDLKQHFDLSTMPYLHCFSELTHPLEQFNELFQGNAAVKQAAYNLIMQIYEESQSRKIGYELAISAAIKNLLLLMLRNDNRDFSALAEDSGISRVRPALDFIDEHLSERISVEDMCSVLNLSYHYFIKYFKKVMGISFVDYVNYKRIKKAERLLLTGDLSIMEVSFEVGILNMAQFYKLFKRHNQCSPKEFKQRMRSQSGLTPLLAQAD
ncbi:MULTISPECIES: AraC family transcriptional regulator [unclassified Paenibacillus]|uniref:helix-turn-helix domain-containing protein n=1 Tax=unclassified Paenibacillus TaxID=185978 RepID=UPI00277D56E5|nr:MULTISPECIES: AraC family transcriptional regulator [unclassified Paenibacillus]MDQ0903620.1 AraC-like DNA-binding protein/mannose-6-phosphate isomerase-like protein (cupin superfamily) [Paenibacillus sp. V4I7]MDQ0917905.1 AraC-like DNA-binding protein/mannose-6-phosphate isomerase-like protein (cupin superfamily) [Paenibacillus sp. V4I5]